jgi:hypothetical protein
MTAVSVDGGEGWDPDYMDGNFIIGEEAEC